MALALRRFVDRWLFQLGKPQTSPIVLGHRKVFILPTAHGLIYLAVLSVMLAGSINYSLSLGFILTFLLAGLGLNGMLYTFRNLANLRVSTMHPRPVFAGEDAEFKLRVENWARVSRFAIEAIPAQGEPSPFDVRPNEEAIVSLRRQTERRGLLPMGRTMFRTRYPLGLFRAWSYIDLDMHCVVYPRPEDPGVPLPPPSGERGEGAASASGNEDFSGLRAYQPGDSTRRIAWKADARGSGLMSKVFSGRADTHLWLDFSTLPPSMTVEERLSRLARWVIEADMQDVAFGLRLADVTIDPDVGPGQRTRCLHALALFEAHR
jgi:uncharacterized protein (DUF58 family)